MNQNLSNFFLCGSAGWCLEILWTGLHSLLAGQRTMNGKTSLLMFPIYGMGAVLPEISRLVDWWLGGQRLDWMDGVIRHGALYTVLIFMGEYLFGSILKAHGICPWDYTGLHSNINGLIRLDFAPLWFGTGLIFERITRKKAA